MAFLTQSAAKCCTLQHGKNLNKDKKFDAFEAELAHEEPSRHGWVKLSRAEHASELCRLQSPFLFMGWTAGIDRIFKRNASPQGALPLGKKGMVDDAA